MNPRPPTCCYCQRPILCKEDLTREHLIPKSKGGNNSPVNLKPCCEKCNTDRDNKSLYKWRSEMQRALNGFLRPEVRSRYIARIEMINYWITFIAMFGHLMRHNPNEDRVIAKTGNPSAFKKKSPKINSGT